MRPLPLRPLPVPTEPLTDYIERLAIANGYHRRELWSVLDRDEQSHKRLLEEALGGLALPRFSGPADPRIEIPVELFGLKPEDFTHVHRRWCPFCINEAAWFRPFWRLKVATNCNIHSVQLLQFCPRCRAYQEPQAILNGKCECGASFTHEMPTATRHGVLINRALEESLSGTTVLDLGESAAQLTTSQLVRLICYVGRFIEGPTLRRPGQIRELENIKVASSLVGGTSALLSNWPATFWHCLERFVEAAPLDASVRRVFGSLYHVLYQDLKDQAFQFMRDAFELFLLEHWRGELCGRHRLFSERTIKNHRHQGLARVARAAGMSSKRLRKMIHLDRFPANQFNPDSARNIITVDKDLLTRLIPAPEEYLDLRTVARILGLKRTRLRQLVAHGAILADAKPDFRISNRWHFQRADVEGFMNKIRHTALITQPTGDTVTLAHVLQFWRVSSLEISELIKALKRREIPFFARENCRLSDLTFSATALRNWITEVRAATVEWISVSKASERLGLKEQVVYELVSRNYIDADVISKNGHATRRISLVSLLMFRLTYISAHELAQLQGTSTTALLRCTSVLPITGPKIDGGRQYFFRRDDFDAATPLSTDLGT